MSTLLSANPVHYPVELQAPDISPYAKGNTDVSYFTTLRSGRPGPHAMVVGLTHGNELCGAIALDYLFREGLSAARGKITLGFINHKAFSGFNALDPLASRYVDQDFNRIWETGTLDGRRTSWEIDRAREIRPLITEADRLLDIHSMQHPSAPLLLSGPTEKGRRFARELGFPTLIIADTGHAAGRRLRDYGAFAIPSSPKNALLVECGQHWATVSADVAIETAIRFLDVAGVIDPAFAAERLPAAPHVPPRVIEVTDAITVQSNDFRFVSPYLGLEVIEEAGTLIGHDAMSEVRTPYDNCVLIMPSRRLTRGQTAVRLGRYVS